MKLRKRWSTWMKTYITEREKNRIEVFLVKENDRIEKKCVEPVNSRRTEHDAVLLTIKIKITQVAFVVQHELILLAIFS